MTAALVTLATDPASRAIAHLLTAPALQFDADRWDPYFADDVEATTGQVILRVDPDVLEEPWSSSQRVLLGVAVDLYNHYSRVTVLSDLFGGLDDESQRTVLEALRIACGLDGAS